MPPPPVRPGPPPVLGAPSPLLFPSYSCPGVGGHGNAPPPGPSPSHHGSQRHFVRLSRNTLSHHRESRPAPELHLAPPVGTCPTGVTCLVLALSSRQGRGLPRRLKGKESVYNAGDEGSMPGSGRPSGEGNSSPHQ